ncbi:hypothetical protein UP10_14495 [Bradyrhizobium sp. LTSPM299]|uniref:hypothetical protein n=1 Tax=Bradyrhizobium sp. LTSPM299 TaxID=1619233 RepID=UPI0005CB6BD0|nr:hypothetical protein [Bradyrhizobium sp. LTSPM299]KJC59902.1 hypothetical protein UP10_14495 [Bradyrhizobium sp. LTSPM299]
MTEPVGATDLLPPQLTPEAATARISELKADPKFTERYLNGEMTARDEFTRLHTVVGKGPPNNDALHRASQLDALKKYADLDDKAWAQVERNGPVHPHERDWALRTREQLMRDRAWVTKYLDGSREEASLMTRISLILSSPVQTEGA